jgi:hypothetical protein
LFLKKKLQLTLNLILWMVALYLIDL